MRAASRLGFTIIEATVSLAITAAAGSALLLGVSTSLNNATALRDETTALGLAQQLVDEALGRRYHGTLAGEGPYQTTLGPAAAEVSGSSRLLFNDVDDYHGYLAQPVRDIYGQTMGLDDNRNNTRHSAFQVHSNYFARWQEGVEVYYVSATNFSQRLSAGQTSDYRAIEVKINYIDPQLGKRQLAAVRRVIAYVPSN